MVFCFVQKFFFEQHESQNINLFCRSKREFFFTEFNIRLYDKNSESDYFFFLHQNQNIFFSNIGNQNIFLEKKNITPTPLEVKWSVPNQFCSSILFFIFLIIFLQAIGKLFTVHAVEGIALEKYFYKLDQFLTFRRIYLI